MNARARAGATDGGAGAARADLRPAAVLFDLDGTLADSFAAIARALNRALREADLPERTLEWVQRHVGRGAAQLVRSAVGSDRAESVTRTVGARFGAHYRAIYLDETPPLPGARDVLAHAAARTGGKVGVVSNKYAALCRAWLDRWGLVELVADVAGPETSGFRKPDPRAVKPVLDRFGVTHAHALLVGDMDVDVETGRNAGVPVVAVRGATTDSAALRRAGALAVLFDLRDLPAWLAGNGRGWR